MSEVQAAANPFAQAQATLAQAEQQATAEAEATQVQAATQVAAAEAQVQTHQTILHGLFGDLAGYANMGKAEVAAVIERWKGHFHAVEATSSTTEAAE